MKDNYKWFKIIKEYQENLDETWYSLVKEHEEGHVELLGEIELYKRKWVFTSFEEVVWYSDCLKDVIEILEELNNGN